MHLEVLEYSYSLILLSLQLLFLLLPLLLPALRDNRGCKGSGPLVLLIALGLTLVFRLLSHGREELLLDPTLLFIGNVLHTLGFIIFVDFLSFFLLQLCSIYANLINRHFMLLLFQDLRLVHHEGLPNLKCLIRVLLHQFSFPTLYREDVVVVDTIILLCSLVLQVFFEDLDGTLVSMIVCRVGASSWVMQVDFLSL